MSVACESTLGERVCWLWSIVCHTHAQIRKLLHRHPKHTKSKNTAQSVSCIPQGGIACLMPWHATLNPRGFACHPKLNTTLSCMPHVSCMPHGLLGRQLAAYLPPSYLPASHTFLPPSHLPSSHTCCPPTHLSRVTGQGYCVNAVLFPVH